eukprot:scaffold1635_cov203-Isochrysis_galbana.AAC.2
MPEPCLIGGCREAACCAAATRASELWEAQRQALSGRRRSAHSWSQVHGTRRTARHRAHTSTLTPHACDCVGRPLI